MIKKVVIIKYAYRGGKIDKASLTEKRKTNSVSI